MTVAVRGGACTCRPPHSRDVHRNGHGRCKVTGCDCLFGPAPVARVPRPRATKQPSRASKLEDLLAHRIELAGLPEPVKQYRWALAEKRQYRSDFAYIEEKLLIECDGGIWVASQGGHTRGAAYTYDCSRDNLAVLLGWRVLRFTDKLIASGEAVQTIRRALTPAGLDACNSSTREVQLTLTREGPGVVHPNPQPLGGLISQWR